MTHMRERTPEEQADLDRRAAAAKALREQRREENRRQHQIRQGLIMPHEPTIPPVDATAPAAPPPALYGPPPDLPPREKVRPLTREQKRIILAECALGFHNAGIAGMKIKAIAEDNKMCEEDEEDSGKPVTQIPVPGSKEWSLQLNAAVQAEQARMGDGQ